MIITQKLHASEIQEGEDEKFKDLIIKDGLNSEL